MAAWRVIIPRHSVSNRSWEPTCACVRVIHSQPCCPVHDTAGHEEIERLERLIVKDFQSEAKSHKEKLHQNHRVKQALESMQSQAERLVSHCTLAGHPTFCVLQLTALLSMLAAKHVANALQLQIYEDADGSRKEEITLLKGEDPMQ